MRILVLGGSGAIGSAVAWDLARDPAVAAIGIVGRDRAALEGARRWLDSPRVSLHPLPVEDRAAMVALMRTYDAGVLALPDRRASYAAVELAIEAGLSIVDVLEEYHRHPDTDETEGLTAPAGMDLPQYGAWLHQRAQARDVTVVDGMGFAPGLANVTLGDGIRRLQTAERAVARVGGIPSPAAAARHPLRYMITWDFAHVLREYTVPTRVREDGRVVTVPAGSALEHVRFTHLGRDEELQCAITPGMPSFLYTRPQLRDFAEKTLRWPGHWEAVQTLRECGLLDLAPIRFAGAQVAPRAFLSALLTPRLTPRPGETDVCVMYNTLTGVRDGCPVRLEWALWSEADPERGLSAMMRTTAFPAAIAARMLARRQISERGIVPPEDCIYGARYRDLLAELERRGIVVAERVYTMMP